MIPIFKKNANITTIDGRKEENVLFNGALNTIYLWLYGVGHMVKDHSESKRAAATKWATLLD